MNDLFIKVFPHQTFVLYGIFMYIASTAQMQVDACELKTRECKVTSYVCIYEKTPLEFQAKKNYLHEGHTGSSTYVHLSSS